MRCSIKLQEKRSIRRIAYQKLQVSARGYISKMAQKQDGRQQKNFAKKP